MALTLFRPPSSSVEKMERLRLSSVLHLFVCCLLFLSSVCSAEEEFRRARQKRGHERSHNLPQFSNSRANSHRKRAVNGSECIESKPAVIKAPKKNVFRQFSGNETQSVTRWLYQQKDLNLSHGYSIRRNHLYTVELLIPNKTDVLAYIDGNGQEPARYAKATLNLVSNGQVTYEDIIVGEQQLQSNCIVNFRSRKVLRFRPTTDQQCHDVGTSYLSVYAENPHPRS